MKLKRSIKSVIPDIICLLYILLFVYAAMSKLLDFENFQVQLRQSPLLSSFANWISWCVPLIELVISILLVFKKTRLLALYLSFILMIMFSTYIYIILNYSSTIPCSCGGILEKLGWTEHLIFNIIFALLAILAVFILSTSNTTKHKKNKLIVIVNLICCSFFGIGIVTVLFIWSEDMIHHNNNFTRRFVAHAAIESKQTDLMFNSYYFAGIKNNKIYLGNITAPSLITVIDTSLKKKEKYTIELDNDRFPFRSVSIKVIPPNFYVMDGTVPCLFQGKIDNWVAKLRVKAGAYYEIPEVIDSSKIVFRTTDPSLGRNILGTLEFKDTINVKYNKDLLQKQVDGIFDTDGILSFSQNLQKIVYIYYYRNEFIIADRGLNLSYRGNTIDTTKHANIKIMKLATRGQTKLNALPLMVNKTIAVHNNLLFVNSLLPGRFESKVMWNSAVVIDVYDIGKNTYLFSFYIYNIKGKKMRKFVVTDTHLYALIENQLVSYKLADEIKNAFSKTLTTTLK